MPVAQPRRLVLIAVALVLLEALAIVGIVVAVVVSHVNGHVPIPLGALIFLAASFLVLAAGLAAGARALARGRRWGRAAVMTAQLLIGLCAFGWSQTGAGPWVWLAVLVAAFVAVVLVLPPVVEQTTRR